MAKLILVCGPTGAGKTTYSISLCKEIGAIRFSIDPWMQTLYSKDMTSLDYSWMMERVERCQTQIWDTAEQILSLDGNAVLDLGFTTKAQRTLFRDWAKSIGIDSELHYLDAPKDVRKKRIGQRNQQKDPRAWQWLQSRGIGNFTVASLHKEKPLLGGLGSGN